MIVGIVAVGGAIVLNAVALAVSWKLDRDGLPAGLDGQAVPRKPGTLKARLPTIGLNLGGQWIGAFLGFWFFEDIFVLGWPGWLQFTAQLGLIVLLDDLWFYWMHRTLHENKRLYKAMHKQHHEAYAPVPIEYVYVNPIEQALGTVGIVTGLALGVLLFGDMSAWVVWIMVFGRILHELEIHSGLRLPTRFIPLLAPMTHHDLHHAKPHKGNFASSFTIWDRLMGTRIKG